MRVCILGKSRSTVVQKYRKHTFLYFSKISRQKRLTKPSSNAKEQEERKNFLIKKLSKLESRTFTSIAYGTDLLCPTNTYCPIVMNFTKT